MKLSEFSKVTGLKRTTLQLYDRKGLLKPVSKTESGYWEYDRDSVSRASMIIILKECGYSLEEIKQTLDSLPDTTQGSNKREIFTECVEKLRRKISQYNGYIDYLENAIVTADNQYLTELVYKNADPVGIVEKSGTIKEEMDSFQSNRDRMMEEYGVSEAPPPDPVIAKFMQGLFMIPLLQGNEPPEGPTVQESLQRLFEYTQSQGEIAGVQAETASEFADGTKVILESFSESLVEMYEKSLGKGCMDYLWKALDVFGNTESITMNGGE